MIRQVKQKLRHRDARTSITAARNALAGQQATAARIAQNARASLASKTADAEEAQADSEAAATEAESSAAAVASGEGAVESGVASVASEGEKGSRDCFENKRCG